VIEIEIGSWWGRSPRHIREASDLDFDHDFDFDFDSNVFDPAPRHVLSSAGDGA
jgi:hypothetical protein